MTSILLTPPAAEPVTLAEAKAHLRIGHEDEDAAITSLIAAARRVIEARTGLCLITQRWTVFRDRWPEDGVITLPLHPVRRVMELASFGEDDETVVIDPAHYDADLASRPARLLLRGDRQWQRPGRAANGIAVTLEAGFGAEPGSVPEPLRQALLLLAAHWYANRGEEQAPPLPADAAALAAAYRAVRL